MGAGAWAGGVVVVIGAGAGFWTGLDVAVGFVGKETVGAGSAGGAVTTGVGAIVTGAGSVRVCGSTGGGRVGVGRATATCGGGAGFALGVDDSCWESLELWLKVTARRTTMAAAAMQASETQKTLYPLAECLSPRSESSSPPAL